MIVKITTKFDVKNRSKNKRKNTMYKNANFMQIRVNFDKNTKSDKRITKPLYTSLECHFFDGYAKFYENLTMPSISKV